MKQPSQKNAFVTHRVFLIFRNQANIHRIESKVCSLRWINPPVNKATYSNSIGKHDGLQFTPSRSARSARFNICERWGLNNSELFKSFYLRSVNTLVFMKYRRLNKAWVTFDHRTFLKCWIIVEWHIFLNSSQNHPWVKQRNMHPLDFWYII